MHKADLKTENQKHIHKAASMRRWHTLGTIDITDFVPLHSRGEVGIAVHKDYRQQGYATDALKLLCEYAFDFLSLSQLFAHVDR